MSITRRYIYVIIFIAICWILVMYMNQSNKKEIEPTKVSDSWNQNAINDMQEDKKLLLDTLK